jgi:hypothetical protein
MYDYRNWGLITFEEYVLLCDETSGVNAKLSVAYIVAHESKLNNHSFNTTLCST